MNSRAPLCAVVALVAVLIAGACGSGGGSSPAAPSAPTGLTATAGDGQITLTWSGTTAGATYNLYWRTSAGVSTHDQTLSNVTSPYVHDHLTNGVTCYYVVTAAMDGRESGLSTEVSATPQAVIGVPGNVTATAADGAVTVKWSNAAQAIAYNLYWSHSTGVTKTNGNRITGVASPYLHAPLTNGRSYYYVVTAVSANGEGAESIEVSATPQAVLPPAAPVGFTAVPSSGQVTLSWLSVAAANSYNLYWSSTTGVTKSNGNKIPGVTSPHIHGQLTNGATYYYVVTAVDPAGESVESVQASATPTAGTSSTHTLTVVRVGAGTGTVTGSGINCGNTCTTSLADGTSVLLTGVAANGGIIFGWAGCDVTNGNSCSLVLRSDRVVTVQFDPCASNCTTRACGGDGCGGSCGTCSGGQTCDATGKCVACPLNCPTDSCGFDGCGGTCACATGKSCDNTGHCVTSTCTPDCSGRQCGPDPVCKTTCGTCTGTNQQCDTTGKCVLVCPAGTGDCDGNISNGCETNLNTGPTNCGSCGHGCDFANASASCSAGSCLMGSCASGHGNCDGDTSNGCETNLETDSQHCGSCSNACGAGHTCTSGSCGHDVNIWAMDDAVPPPGWQSVSPILVDGYNTGYSTPHTFVDVGTHTFTVPGTDGCGHSFTGWDTGETSTTINISSGGTYTAHYGGSHEIKIWAMDDAVPSPGWQSVSIAVDGLYWGTTPATFTETESHTFTVPSVDDSGHHFTGWDNGETSATITISCAGTYTAHYGP
jgi:fibronectin type 3 domain-containing protein